MALSSTVEREGIHSSFIAIQQEPSMKALWKNGSQHPRTVCGHCSQQGAAVYCPKLPTHSVFIWTIGQLTKRALPWMKVWSLFYSLHFPHCCPHFKSFAFAKPRNLDFILLDVFVSRKSNSLSILLLLTNLLKNISQPSSPI